MLNKKALTPQMLADQLGASIKGDSNSVIRGLATLSDAGPSDVSFFTAVKYKQQLFTTNAACVLIRPKDYECYQESIPNVISYLLVDDPYLAYAKISSLFKLEEKREKIDVHPSAVIEESVTLGKEVTIGPNVVIGQGCEIGDRAIIKAGAYVGEKCIIGAGSVLCANVTLYNDVHIGQDCILHSMSVIGADGFGFAPSSLGWQKIHQLGGVRIGNNVEIGAGTTVDRGALNHTEIHNGVKIDNQVQIAHNVIIGQDTAIAAAAAIAGSAVIGQRCTIAGGVGIVGHITITDDVHVTAMTMVTKSISSAGSYSSGVPMNESRRWKKNAARFNQLDDMARQLKLMKK